jgi:hypothetical protein
VQRARRKRRRGLFLASAIFLTDTTRYAFLFSVSTMSLRLPGGLDFAFLPSILVSLASKAFFSPSLAASRDNPIFSVHEIRIFFARSTIIFSPRRTARSAKARAWTFFHTIGLIL